MAAGAENAASVPRANLAAQLNAALTEKAQLAQQLVANKERLFVKDRAYYQLFSNVMQLEGQVPPLNHALVCSIAQA